MLHSRRKSFNTSMCVCSLLGGCLQILPIYPKLPFVLVLVLYVSKKDINEIMNTNPVRSIKILCDISFKVGHISLDISPLSDNTWQVELIFLQVSQHCATRAERTRTHNPLFSFMVKLGRGSF